MERIQPVPYWMLRDALRSAGFRELNASEAHIDVDDQTWVLTVAIGYGGFVQIEEVLEAIRAQIPGLDDAIRDSVRKRLLGIW